MWKLLSYVMHQSALEENEDNFDSIPSSFDSIPSSRKNNGVVSVVRHVSRRCTELGIGFDNFVHSLEEIFLSGHLPACTNGKHASLRAHAAHLRTCNMYACQRTCMVVNVLGTIIYVEQRCLRDENYLLHLSAADKNVNIQ